MIRELRYSEINDRNQNRIARKFGEGFNAVHDELDLTFDEAVEVLTYFDPICGHSSDGWGVIHAFPNPMQAIGDYCCNLAEDRFDRWLKKDEQ